MNIKELKLVYHKNPNFVEINDLSALMKNDNKLDKLKIIALILKLLKENKNVIYNPISLSGYNKKNYDLLHKMIRKTNNSLEMIFTPSFKNEYESSNFSINRKYNLISQCHLNQHLL